MTKDELLDWLRPYTPEARIALEVDGRFVDANIRYEFGKNTNYTGTLVVYPSRENS